jgi:integrase
MMTKKPRDKLPRNVHREPSRHGAMRYYFRPPGGARVRLFETPGTQDFENEVAKARIGTPGISVGDGKAEAPRVKNPRAGTLDWLLKQYKKRAAGSVSIGLWERRLRMLEEICDSLKGKVRRGSLPFAMMRRRHVLEIRDGLRQEPGARNNVLKALSAMFSWAVDSDFLEINPAHKISRLAAGKGFHTWSVEEVMQFEAKHPVGTRARLALDIALYTGLRRQEVAILGRQHVKDGWIKITPGKTRKSSGAVVEIPMLPQLASSIAATPTGDLTYLTSEYGKAFTVDGLGNRVRDWCDRAGLPHCTLHGLRKAGATIAAENGATDEELMAIFGWTTKQQTTTYTRAVDRKRLAKGAIHKLIPTEPAGENGNKSPAPVSPVRKSAGKIAD